MIFLELVVIVCVTLSRVWADVGPGRNEYLPPDKGYKYPVPQKPFTTPSRPPIRPSTSFTPSYTPVPTRPQFTTPKPSYGPPTFTQSTTQRPYRPSPPGPTYGTPTVPTYRPTGGPTSTPFRPTQRPYRPPGPPYDGQPSDHDHVHDHHDHHHHHEPGMPFDFAYSVNDIEHGNDYSHNAVSDGDVTRGEYRIQLPDGRTQIVKYTADWKNGFNAQVSFEGQPTYPNYQGSGSNQQGGGYKY